MAMVVANVTLCNKRERYLSYTEKYGGTDVGGGTMVLGAVMVFAHTGLIDSPYYNIELKEIHVAGKQLALFPGTSDGKHGTILDRGTTYAYLPEAAFKAYKYDMDRASILGDAIDYVKDLLQRINDLQNELETTSQGSLVPTSSSFHPLAPTPTTLPQHNKEELCPTSLPSPKTHPARVEVRAREGRGVSIHMFCARRPNLLHSTLKAGPGQPWAGHSSSCH